MSELHSHSKNGRVTAIANQKAIDSGMSNQDPAVQAYWRRNPHKGDKPTPEELIDYLSGQVKKILGSQ